MSFLFQIINEIYVRTYKCLLMIAKCRIFLLPSQNMEEKKKREIDTLGHSTCRCLQSNAKDYERRFPGILNFRMHLFVYLTSDRFEGLNYRDNPMSTQLAMKMATVAVEKLELFFYGERNIWENDDLLLTWFLGSRQVYKSWIMSRDGRLNCTAARHPFHI